MLHRHLWLFLFTVLAFQSSAQHHLPSKAGARGIATGNANIVYQDIYSIFNNPAGLAHLKQWSAVGFVENRFLVSELNTATLGVAKPTSSGTFGFLLQYFGFELYKEQKLGLVYSRKLTNGLAIGVEFDLLHTGIAGYGNAFALTFDLGLQYQIAKQLQAGFNLFNPIRTSILPPEPLPTILQIGFAYTPSKYLTLSTSLEKASSTPYSIKLGLEYLLLDKVFLRGGIQTKPSLLSMGIGYQLPKLALNMAMNYHQVFGVSPAFGMEVNRK